MRGSLKRKYWVGTKETGRKMTNAAGEQTINTRLSLTAPIGTKFHAFYLHLSFTGDQGSDMNNCDLSSV